MDNLVKRARYGLARFQIALALIIFLPARSWEYWQGLVYWFVFSAACLAISIYLLEHDLMLVRRRMSAGPANTSSTYSMIAVDSVSTRFPCFIAGIVPCGLIAT